MPDASRQHGATRVNRGDAVILRHARTEQTAIVPLARYQKHAAGRYRNWRLARGNLIVRPVLTITECLAAHEARV